MFFTHCVLPVRSIVPRFKIIMHHNKCWHELRWTIIASTVTRMKKSTGSSGTKIKIRVMSALKF